MSSSVEPGGENRVATLNNIFPKSKVEKEEQIQSDENYVLIYTSFVRFLHSHCYNTY